MSKHDDEIKTDSAPGTEEDSDKSLPLMGGVIGGEDLAGDLDGGSASSGRKISQGTLIVLFVLIAGIGAIYVMRISTPEVSGGGAKEMEAKIEQALAKLTQPKAMAPNDPLAAGNIDSLFKDTESIVRMFASDQSQRQVPLEFVQKNPFKLPFAPEATAPAATPAAASAAPTPRPTAATPRNDGFAALRKLEAELKDYKLQMIMNGRIPVASVSGTFIKADQKLGSFTVKSVNPATMTVVLEAEGREFTLAMEEKTLGPSNKVQTIRNRP